MQFITNVDLGLSKNIYIKNKTSVPNDIVIVGMRTTLLFFGLVYGCILYIPQGSNWNF